MYESWKQQLFREPDRVWMGLLWLSGSLLYFGLYLYYSVSRGSHSSMGLILGTLFLLAALPECLPSERRYLAGLLRIVSIGYAALVVGYILIVV